MAKKIELPIGSNIDKAVNKLLEAKSRGESVYCEFNGHILYSDTVTMDSAYLEITGLTKEAHDKELEESSKNYKIEYAKNKKKAIENIPSWIEQGKKLIFSERHKEWEKAVIARANDLYHGLELDAALEIMQAIEDGIDMKQVAKMLDGQGHSGMSASLVRNIVFHFSSKGPEFCEATAYGEISPEEKHAFEVKKQENIELRRANEILPETQQTQENIESRKEKPIGFVK